MGTTYSVKVSPLPAGLSAESLQADIDRGLAEVNRQMSTWQKDSELSQFNRYEKTDWFPVSPEFARVVKQALEVSRADGRGV